MPEHAYDIVLPEPSEIPLIVTFVRHAQAGNNTEPGRISGPKLTELGRMQAERLADRLAKEKFHHIYTSDLNRAYETAQEILKYHTDTPFTVTTDIREITHFHFLPKQRPVKPVTRKSIGREREILDRFVANLRNLHNPGERVLVVCHGNVIRTILPVLGGRDPKNTILIELNNTSVTIIDVWCSGEAVLKLANCVRHLLPNQIT
jgi:2,3-bisphosphoglycerate-dependent phosphoglycerate mutase